MSTRLYTCNFTPFEEEHIQNRIALARRTAIEECAKIADQVAINAERRAASHTAQSQAQEAAYNKMEGAQQAAQQIRDRLSSVSSTDLGSGK